MKDCKRHRRELVAFLYGELTDERKKELESHLDSCLSCREELAALVRVVKSADSLRADIEGAMAAVDWDLLPETVASAVLEKDVQPTREAGRRSFFEWILRPRLKPVLAGLLAGFALGSLMTFWLMRIPGPRPDSKESFHVSRGFLDRVELEMARRDTLDYLEKSQYVLLDLVQKPGRKAMDAWQRSLASQKARALLMKKQYINPQLNKFRLAKAKEICDQIELLFFELIRLSDDLSEKDLLSIRNLIEERQLLLKINLLKKELEESEV